MGDAENYFSVGDWKEIELNGTMGTAEFENYKTRVYILGFDHNWELEGKGITFGCFKDENGKDICLVDSEYGKSSTDGTHFFNMNHSGNYNYGGWAGCDMRYDILGSTDVQPSDYGSAPTTSKVGYDATSTCATNPVENTLMSCLPSELRVVMKPMTKYTNNVGNSDTSASQVTATKDYLPLLAEWEVFNTRLYGNQYEKENQKHYDYFVVQNRAKYCHNATDSAAIWHGRTPGYLTGVFTAISSNGSGGGAFGFVGISYGIAPIFLI